MDKLEPISILVATRNRHKVTEIQSVIGDRFRVFSLEEILDVDPDPESADTFEGNAKIKAESIARRLREAASFSSDERSIDYILADDSGLEVDALDGLPGVRSARFALEEAGQDGNAPDQANNTKLLRLLKDVPLEQRTARFRCCLWVMELDGQGRGFAGSCEGRILLESRGQNGFGYDPLFVPDPYEKTFAELGDSIKNTLSHRAQALNRMKAWFSAGRT